jgi:hypothetical protein
MPALAGMPIRLNLRDTVLTQDPLIEDRPMKSQISATILAGLIFAAILLFVPGVSRSGLGDLGSYQGRMVPEEDRIALEQGQQTARWKGDDLSVEYRYTHDQNVLDISGVVRFADVVTYNFDSVSNFHLSVFFADSQGKIVGNRGLITVARLWKTAGTEMDTIPFQTRIVLPPGAETLAFGYSGFGTSSGGSGGHGRHGGGGGGGGGSFWKYPVR